MARKKSAEDTVTITFRAPADVAAGLKDLAHLSRRDLSAILVDLCGELVAANKQRILSFRRSAAQPIKLPTFATSTKKAVAQKTAPTLNDAATVEGSEPDD